MARRYDSRTTIFSPEGRLYQVEYAMEAIGNAGSAVGILAQDGVVLAAEKRITSKVFLIANRCRSVSCWPSYRFLTFNPWACLAAPGHKCCWCATREDVQTRWARCLRSGWHYR